MSAAFYLLFLQLFSINQVTHEVYTVCYTLFKDKKLSVGPLKANLITLKYTYDVPQSTVVSGLTPLTSPVGNGYKMSAGSQKVLKGYKLSDEDP